MKKDLKILLIINWKEEGKWDLYRNLRGTFSNLDIIQPSRLALLQKGNFWRLNKYLSEFYLPFKAFVLRNKYDLIFSWSMRIGITYGILKRVFGDVHRSKHVIYDFHLNLERNDIIYRFKLMLVRFAVKGIDFFLTTSKTEESIYAQMFGIHKDRIRFFPIFAPGYFLNYSAEPGDYLFSYGNSDRDYDTLVKAVKGLPVKLKILSQNYRPKLPLPDNVELIVKPHFGIDLIRLILGSRMVILPLVAHNVSAGQTALLESMALGRTVIVTENFATKEYGSHGETLFFYEAGNVEQLRTLITKLFDDKQTLSRIGENARRSVPRFAEMCLEVFEEITEKLV